MKIIKINDKEYQIIKEYKDGFDLTLVAEKLTEYFDEYDYVFGDWSYGKIRLKGFCEDKNKMCNPTNNIKNLDDYIKKYCSYECKYFLLKKNC